MYRITLIALVVIVLSISGVAAGDFGFERTEEGILQRLLKPPKKSENPSLTTRGTNWLTTPTTFQVRGITVRPRLSGQNYLVEKTVNIPRERTGGYVNLAVRFDFNSYAIRPGSISILNKLGAAIVRPKLKERALFVNGHTDTDGTETYNLHLSLKRAIAVRDYLINNLDIAPPRLRVMGYGEGVPLVEHNSTQNKQLNRRVEIVANAP